MNYNEQVKYEVPITIASVDESKLNVIKEEKSIKISEIIKIKK